jgi:hypothetical protein
MIWIIIVVVALAASWWFRPGTDQKAGATPKCRICGRGHPTHDHCRKICGYTKVCYTPRENH